MDFQDILVICTGNICRSPMAEAMLKSQFPSLMIHSAGLINLNAQAADRHAQLCMQRLGLDIEQHRSTVIHIDVVKQADVILVMTTQQKYQVEQLFPFSKGKVFRLGHWRQQDIIDPYQKSQQVFDQTCQLIQECTQDWKIYFKA